MGYDFIAVSSVDVCEQLPSNALPYAECMYRANNETYYESNALPNEGNTTHQSDTIHSRTYYKATNRSHTTSWSINLHSADELIEALRNQGVNASHLFSHSFHSATTLHPLLQQLQNVSRQSSNNEISNSIFTQLIRLLECACDGGILLNV